MKPENRPSRRVVLRLHAEQRMFARGISTADVETALASGQTIEEYPMDKPYPSRLVLGWIRDRPLHIVVAENRKDGETIVITAYEPGTDKWDAGFSRRRR